MKKRGRAKEGREETEKGGKKRRGREEVGRGVPRRESSGCEESADSGAGPA